MEDRKVLWLFNFFRMSCLHIWFSKLKWSMDVLLRFYERHAFICALHKETRLLFDELIFCLQVRSVIIIICIDKNYNEEYLTDRVQFSLNPYSLNLQWFWRIVKLNTGLISEIKYGLTVTLICVLVTFQAYLGLTRCAPFDKICPSNFLEPF